MAGLSAALQLTLAGEAVTLYEAAPFAGGRCRSFYDREIDCRIDNGNHLVLSGNVAIQDYLFLTGAEGTMGGPGKPVFPFLDIESAERWTARMNEGRFPSWIFSRARRVPGTGPLDYLSILRFLFAGSADRVIDRINPANPLYRRFWYPMVIGVLNTEPEIASAELMANVLRQSFALGGRACIPQIPKIGLSETFVIPCLNLLRNYGVEVKYTHRLQALTSSEKQVRALEFANNEKIELGPDDWVILALPAWVMRELMPGLSTPDDFRSIVNAHFRVDGIEDPVGFTGIIGGLAEWVFARAGVVSVTVSCVERYGNYPVRDMAYYIWKDVAALYDLDPEKLPPHRIFKEKYATFAATPEQNLRRPNAWIGWKNIALAGEWTATGLPSTIEGAIRSGLKAAQVVMRWD
jgi:squalene-associated FAD-dependent desaturase